jgi:hypothetical protein
MAMYPRPAVERIGKVDPTSNQKTVHRIRSFHGINSPNNPPSWTTPNGRDEPSVSDDCLRPCSIVSAKDVDKSFHVVTNQIAVSVNPPLQAAVKRDAALSNGRANLVLKQLILAHRDGRLTGKVGQQVGKTVKSARMTQKKYNKDRSTATLQPRFQPS